VSFGVVAYVLFSRCYFVVIFFFFGVCYCCRVSLLLQELVGSYCVVFDAAVSVVNTNYSFVFVNMYQQ